MKILFVTRYHSRFPDNDFAGGDETIHRMMQGAFEEAGHTVEFLGQEDAERLGVNRLIDRILGHRYLLGAVWLTSRVFQRIKENYDLVICNSVFSYGIKHPRAIVLFHFSSAGVSELYSIRNNPLKYLAFLRWSLMEKWGARNKKVVAVSGFIKEKLEGVGIKVDEIIHNAIDIDKFNKMEIQRENRCMFVGRYDRYLKGFDILEKLAEHGVEIDCCTNIDPGNGLHWIGIKKHSDMALEYNRHKIVIFPSRYESFGLVPLEAMACGVPVLMNNTGIGIDLYNYIPEFVVDVSHKSIEYEYLRRINIINLNYRQYSDMARRFVEQYFSYDMFKKKWIELIDHVSI